MQADLALSSALCCQGISSANQHHFVRIPLETSDQLRFTGVLHLGSPPRGVRVVFDTGSSDTWVFSINAAIGDEGQASRAFTVGYGGGIVSGVAAPTDLQLGSGLADELLLRNVPVGFADDHTSPQSSSQSSKDSYGFWALRVHDLSFGNVTLSFGNPNRNAGVALLDSGTSVLLLSKYTIESIVRVLSAGFGTRLLSPSNDKRALPVCRPCHAHEFPPLAFDFAMGSDYVRCNQRRRECTAMIDAFDPSEVSDHLDDVVILGTVFFRAFYARFDYSNKQVSLACSLDDHAVCRGVFSRPWTIRDTYTNHTATSSSRVEAGLESAQPSLLSPCSLASERYCSPTDKPN
ncbi:Peptidase family A1 domain [Phytophthora cactorum]|nr:Peptidase family A1 domain [Phytophthora cactorum]